MIEPKRRYLQLVFVIAALALSIPSLADDSPGGRWGGTPTPTPSATEGGGTSTGPSSGHRPGFNVLKLNQRVSATLCQANPVSCLCPPDSVKIVFYETGGMGKLSRKKLTCLPAACPIGEILRKRNTADGNISFNCEKPKS